MKKTTLSTLDPQKLSPTMQKLNPHLMKSLTELLPDTKRLAEAVTGAEFPPKRVGKRRKEMNKTEADFSRLLDARKNRHEILSWDYEGLTLRWPDGMRYTPDFVVFDLDDYVTLIEVKGAYAWAKDIVKFRAARDRWTGPFTFQFWQKIDGIWQETR